MHKRMNNQTMETVKRTGRNGLLYDIDESPPGARSWLVALQHVCGMFGATILVPILVNKMAGAEVLSTPVALVTAGVGTLIYSRCTKKESPVYLGSSFAFISPIALAYQQGGLGAALTGAITVGLVYLVVVALLSLIGSGWIDKLLPDRVVGPMIAVIGLGLSSSAISQIGINEGGSATWKEITVAAIAVLTIAFAATCRIQFLRIIPFLIGIVISYVAAVLLGIVDFSPVVEAEFFSIPKFILPVRDYALDFSQIIIFIAATPVTISEHIGDHKSLSKITGRDLLRKPGLVLTLRGDALASLFAALVGGPPNTSYGENTGIVGLTRVASTSVIRKAAVISIGLGFLGKFTALVSTIPNAVLGGVSLVLYGYIAMNGIRTMQGVDYHDNKNIIIGAVMLTLGIGGAILPLPGNAAFSGMSLSAIVGIILNIFVPDDAEGEAQEETESA